MSIIARGPFDGRMPGDFSARELPLMESVLDGRPVVLELSEGQEPPEGYEVADGHAIVSEFADFVSGGMLPSQLERVAELFPGGVAEFRGADTYERTGSCFGHGSSSVRLIELESMLGQAVSVRADLAREQAKSPHPVNSEGLRSLGAAVMEF